MMRQPLTRQPSVDPFERQMHFGLSLGLDSHVVAASQLGLDVETYLMLRQLEQRDINPEDYELLGRLDERQRPKTLQEQDLARFEVSIYSGPSPSPPELKSTICTTSTYFGPDFWRLPMLELVDEAEETVAEPAHAAAFGVDFWKLPLDDAESDDTKSTCTSMNGWNAPVCGVCLVDLIGGDEIRTLSCGHHFHRECIDHWLLNCSIACPVDKKELLS